MHVAMADEAVRIGPPPSQQSYLKGDTILSVAKETGAEKLPPFLINFVFRRGGYSPRIRIPV